MEAKAAMRATTVSPSLRVGVRVPVWVRGSVRESRSLPMLVRVCVWFTTSLRTSKSPARQRGSDSGKRRGWGLAMTMTMVVATEAESAAEFRVTAESENVEDMVAGMVADMAAYTIMSTD